MINGIYFFYYFNSLSLEKYLKLLLSTPINMQQIRMLANFVANNV